MKAASLLAAVLVVAANVAAQKPYDLPGTAPAPASKEPGLLFYLSGDHGFRADYAAGGVPDPNYIKDVKILPGGAKGSYLQCEADQLLSYWAPGNIYSQRGTLAFDWRSRTPVDQTEFPVFRVGFGDHSSWDMVWLRIDYNGHGFDAFVTDVNLGRTRVSVPLNPFPGPDLWTHLALSWDETTGIRFYVNGKLVATKAATGMFDSALDQFGPHSRIIAPTGVESSYNYDRGGDIDELRIYDRALSDENVASLARNEPLENLPAISRSVAQPTWQQEWWHSYGWNRPNDFPAPLPAAATAVRKVEIHDAYDLKRWWWKANDGIRETTWPGVYNRSKLTGRFDYFQLPDWDCYALSGKSVTFYLPDEPWNHLEMEGGAWGNVALLTPGGGDPKAVADPDQWDASPQSVKPLFTRPEGQERTTFDLAQPITGEHVRFTNAVQEWPLGEFAAYYVHPGAEPKGVATLSYTVSSRGSVDNPSLTELTNWIHDRFPADERATLVAQPGVSTGGGRTAIPTAKKATAQSSSLPIVHILIPADFRGLQADEGHGASYSWENMHAGLDGIAIDLPALNLAPTHNGYIPMNIQIKDPIWTMRDMLDFSFSVKPGEPHTLWLDTRDRILPNGKSLYLTIASASGEFGPAALEGMKVRLIFKSFEAAKPEHVADRVTQVRDNYANLVEESVNSRRLNIFNRVDADATDLLRVDPDNVLGRQYWHELNHEQTGAGIAPPFTPPAAPAGVPDWAFLQVTDLGMLSDQINWWIDNRQISDGEFGGGLSDDTDYLNWWPGLAFMGDNQKKLTVSLERALDATFANGMWANGLASAQYDELHSYEDGLNTLGQALQLDFGSPKQLERAMESSRALFNITGVNSLGERQVRTSYYSGTKMATGGVWGWGKVRSYMVFHPALQLVLYNGTPQTKKMVTELADGFLAHRRAEANGRMTMHYDVNFNNPREDKATGNTPWFILWAAYRWTGDQKYLLPFSDDPPTALRLINSDALDMLKVRDTWGQQMLKTSAPDVRTDAGVASETNEHLAWQLTGDTSHLDKLYLSQIETATDRKFINTEGSLWIDRVYFNNGELQRARLGGVALMRNYDYPGNVVSWQFAAPATEKSVAILIPEATPTHFKVVAYNLDSQPVTAQMTGWEVDPGRWNVSQGTQATPNGPVANLASRTVDFERSASMPIIFAPNTTTVLEFTLKTPGVPYWSRPDLGIDFDDVRITGQTMQVTVHSLGAVDAPAAKLVLRDATGKTLASTLTPALKAPTDLYPKTATVSLKLPTNVNLKGGTVTIESSGPTPEITQRNNRVDLP